MRVEGSRPPIEEEESTNPGGGGSGTPPPPPNPGVEFDDDDLEALNDEWQDCTGNIQRIDGYLEYEETDYRWETSTEEVPGLWGETVHNPQRVTIYPVNINTNSWGVAFEHFATQTILNEYVHTIQGPPSILNDNMFDREVEAYNLSYHWYKALFRQNPPFTPYTQQQINDAKSNSGYIAAVDDIEDLRQKLDTNGSLTAQEYQELLDLSNSLYDYLPERNYDRNYDKDALDCED